MPEPDPNPEASELEALLNAPEPAAVLDAILGNTPSFVVIQSAPDGRVVRFSGHAAQILGWRPGEMEGRTIAELQERLPAYDLSGRTLPPNERPMMRALRGEAVTGFEFLAEAANGERIPVVVNAAPIRNARGEVVGAISSATDLRPYKAMEQCLREALAQRETLYRELTHRVKNHLQIISGLISAEARDPKLSAEGLAEMMQGRLRALAAVYDSMTLAGIGCRIGARAFIEEVCRAYASRRVKVEAVVDPPDLTLMSEQAGPIGMLVNEAVSNSYKHAFPDKVGRIWVILSRSDRGRLRLEVADDGVGWGPLDAARTSHGLKLMRLFARQLHGALELADRPGGGALVTAEMPDAPERAARSGVGSPAGSPHLAKSTGTQ